MSNQAYQEYLLANQYRNASNLNARIALHELFSVNKYGWQRWVFDQLAIPNGGKVLELGSGPGKLWLENLDRVPADWQITLSDFSPGMVQQAKDNLATALPNAIYERVDAQAIPFPNSEFDAVIANHMLYHVPDRSKAFAEIRRVLRPDGHFYAATNGLKHIRELDELVERFDPALALEFSIVPRGDPDWFSLENGAAELSRFFANVTLRPYEDALLVTEVAPLVDYVLSTDAANTLQGEKLMRFVEFVADEMQAQGGAIRISKASGLFIAQ